MEGLSRHRVEVIECHVPFWHGVEDRVQTVKGGWFSVGFFSRVIRTYYELLQIYWKIGDYDLMVVGYPGQIDIFIAWILTRLKNRPLVWDVLMSIYLLMNERDLKNSNNLTARLIHLIEAVGLKLPDLIIIEGEEYANWLCTEYSLDKKYIHTIPLGTNEEKFPLLPSKSETGEPFFLVIYFGAFLQNHGVDQMINAVEILRNEETIRFEFIGTGPEFENIVSYSKENKLNNVVFSGYLESDQFFTHLADADLCLGSFGHTTHSMITVQNKIYETLVMGKPLLTGESPAILQVFCPDKHLFAVQRTPQEIANKILFLRDHPEILSVIAKQGRDHVIEYYSITPLGARFLTSINSLMKLSNMR